MLSFLQSVCWGIRLAITSLSTSALIFLTDSIQKQKLRLEVILKPWVGYEITFCLPQKNLPDTSQNTVDLSRTCPANDLSLFCSFPKLASIPKFTKSWRKWAFCKWTRSDESRTGAATNECYGIRYLLFKLDITQLWKLPFQWRSEMTVGSSEKRSIWDTRHSQSPGEPAQGEARVGDCREWLPRRSYHLCTSTVKHLVMAPGHCWMTVSATKKMLDAECRRVRTGWNTPGACVSQQLMTTIA